MERKRWGMDGVRAREVSQSYPSPSPSASRSLACVCAAARSPAADSTIAGLGLFNCAIGMNSKAEPLADDPPAYAFFFALAKPLFVLIDVLLRSPLAGALFDKVRTPETVRSVLEKGVYMNSDRVDDELVNMITRPATDEGALQTFVERVRARDRRLARLAAAVSGGEPEWQSAHDVGALSDAVLLPRLAPELTLLPSPRPAARVAASGRRS